MRALSGKPGNKAERDELRAQMLRIGCTTRQITDEMMRRWQFRPRQAWRFAFGLTQDEVAARCTALLDDRTQVSSKRISEYERWPLGGVRPSVRTLSLLGQIYGVRPDDLVDGVDRRNLPADYVREVKDRGDVVDLRRLGPRTDTAPLVTEPVSAPRWRSSPQPTEHQIGSPANLASRTPRVEEAAIMAAAYESSEHASQAETSNVGPATLEGLHEHARRLARDLVHGDALVLFPEMVRTRDRVYRILEGHQHPRQTRELYFLAAAACCLLAEASQGLGLRAAALEQTRAAWAYAELAGHDSVRAWCRSAQSWHAFRDGRAHDAVALARSGQQYARSNPASQQRLHSMEGTALALMGDDAGALRAFRAATDDRERIHSRDDFFDGIGGVFVADEPKQHHNEANGMIILGRAEDAARCARTAVNLYARVPVHQRDSSLEPSARVTLATAALLTGDVEAAAEELHPVLAMEPHMRSDNVVWKLREFSAQLRHHAHGAGRHVAELRAEIDAFRMPALPGGLA